MQYFILLPGDTEADCVKETNILGESSFNTFYGAKGLTALMKMIEQYPEVLEDVTIKTDTGKSLTIEEFLSTLQNLKVITWNK
jgi:hypothetical protein